MALSCGCELNPGVPITPEGMKVHYRHTFESLLFWEMIRRSGVPQDISEDSISVRRLAYTEALDKAFPELQD